MFDTDKFIISIQDQPVLWDKATKEHSNKDSREKAWVSCGAVMYENWEVMTAEERNKKVNDMKNKWRHVRDNFLKSLNRGKSGDPAIKMRKYIYADSLQFLLTTVDKRKTSGNIDTQDVEDNENSQQDEETPDDIAGSSRDPTLIQSPPEASLRPGTKKMTAFQIQLLKSIEKSEKPPEKDDADKFFMMSLLPDYKQLNDQAKLEFKLMTLQFFQNYHQRRHSLATQQPHYQFQPCHPHTSSTNVYSSYGPPSTGIYMPPPSHFPAQSPPMNYGSASYSPSPSITPGPSPSPRHDPSPSPTFGAFPLPSGRPPSRSPHCGPYPPDQSSLLVSHQQTSIPGPSTMQTRQPQSYENMTQLEELNNPADNC